MCALLTPSEVAEQLGVEEELLLCWRERGLGPRSLKLGEHTLRFISADVVTWVLEQSNAETPVLEVAIPDEQTESLPMSWEAP